jgi:hypothetical protein
MFCSPFLIKGMFPAIASEEVLLFLPEKAERSALL